MNAKNTKRALSGKKAFKSIVRVSSTIFLGAIFLGLTSTSATLNALEIKKERAYLVAENTGNPEKNLAIENEKSKTISFEEFISGMICRGCGRHCPLANLKCAKGDDYLKKAREEYEKNQKNKVALCIGGVEEGKLLAVMDIAPLGGLAVGSIYFIKDKMSSGKA